MGGLSLCRQDTAAVACKHLHPVKLASLSSSNVGSTTAGLSGCISAVLRVADQRWDSHYAETVIMLSHVQRQGHCD